MGFRLRNDAKKWFQPIRENRDNNFDQDWDSYYYCLVAGLLSEQKSEATNTVEFNEGYTKRYLPRAKLLIGLFLSKEIKKMGVSFSEKKQVHKVISALIDPMSPNFLKDDGIKEFNKYAHAGFDELCDNMEKPYTLEDFLISFDNYVKKNNY